MISRKLKQCAASAGLALVLLVGVLPGQAGAEEAATYTPFKTVQSRNEVDVTLSVAASIHEDSDELDQLVPFTFVLDAAEEDETTPVPEDNTIVIHNEGTESFETLKFTSTGVYEYTIDQEEGEHPGLTYDDTVYLVTITVDLDRYRNLRATVRVEVEEAEDKVSAIAFVNLYDDPTPEPEESETPAPETPAPESPTPETPTPPAVTEIEATPESPEPSAGTETPKPTQTKTPTKTVVSTPKTGDETNNFRWIVVLAVVIMGAITCVWYLVVTKKHNKDEKES